MDHWSHIDLCRKFSQDEFEDKHRHFWHICAVHPACATTPEMPELFQAVPKMSDSGLAGLYKLLRIPLVLNTRPEPTAQHINPNKNTPMKGTE